MLGMLFMRTKLKLYYFIESIYYSFFDKFGKTCKGCLHNDNEHPWHYYCRNCEEGNNFEQK